MMCRQAFKAPRCRAPKSSFGSLKNHSTKAQGLAISLSKELTFTQHSQSVLRTKDMNTKLLDGLEMFLSVCVGCSATPAIFKWPGEHIYIGYQLKLAVCSR